MQVAKWVIERVHKTSDKCINVHARFGEIYHDHKTRSTHPVLTKAHAFSGLLFVSAELEVNCTHLPPLPDAVKTCN